ncbi:alpha/beta fold hydrolase [Nonomuraea endophytica]|uniref:Pimeloyl-ACP methyl ester carboxylesterase n=1 Tax=Nonomuraea endophytica TaxID=714136 RepID=A0A7W8A5S3_9ACTN|nr:alpha/beta fold hydrolase [Nonomuraea endophytica]MBB5080107.1 pimeloyl-ACP methyl ester carboxylesterase [Nonomuraea endophytica]
MHIRTALVLLTPLVAVAACGTVATTAKPKPSAPAAAWRPCPGGEGVECADVKVPLDWSEPGGPAIEIAVARRKAPKSEGTIVYLPGGPGQAGVETLIGSKEFGGLERRYDIVSLDPRGVGASSPLTCPAEQVMALGPDRLPTTDAQLRQLRQASTGLAEACRKATGPAFDHLDSASAAQDLDRVRQAIGADKITIYSHSYGTLLAQEYAARFGQRLRGAVLDGVMDHSLDRRTFTVSAARALEESFGEFVAWCAKDKTCEVDDPVAAYRRVLAKAERGKLGKDENGRAWTPYTVTATIDAMLFTPSWPAAGMFLNTLDKGKPWRTDGDDTLPKRINYADPIVCQDYAMAYRDAAEIKADLAAAAAVAPTVRYSPNAMKTVLTCQGWPAPVKNPQRESVSKATTPLLLLQSRYDNATPVAWAANVAKQLGERARLTVLPDWTHAMKLHNKGCQARYAVDYLTTLKLPPANPACTSTPPGVTL